MANNFLQKQIAKATFDATGGTLIGTYNVGIIIPSGAIITDAYYNVRTTFTSAGADAGTIAISANSAGDIKAAIAISDASNVWDAGLHGGLPGNWALDGNALTAIAMAAGRATAMILTTAVRQVTVAVATQDLTAGVMDIYVEYYY